jgi:tyrosyl-tRNA synthetase
MSKSFANTVDIALPPFEKYSKIMAMRDEALPLLFETLTDVPMAELAELRAAHPMQAKQRLAHAIVAQFDNPAAAAQAEEAWTARFRRRELPAELPEHAIGAPANIVELLAAAGMAPSRSEARRLIAGGGVRVDGVRVDSADATVTPPAVVQVGRRRVVRVVPGGNAER